MNVLICISRVPDTATKIVVGSDGKTIDNQGVKFIINPYDEYAIEEGLRIKEKFGGSVTAVTVGSEQSSDILRTALAMGVEKATIIKAPEIFDSYFVAYNLAEYAKSIKPDIILLGRQSVDFDSFQIPSLLAGLIDYNLVTVVSKLTIDANKIICERDVEGGKEIVETNLPCIISAQKGLNEPRYPKLPDIMKAKSKPIEILEAKPTDLKMEVISMEIPMKQRIGKILSDSDEDINELVRLLHEEAKVI